MFYEEYLSLQLILEVDLHYPIELHYKDDYYKMVSENMQIDFNILSKKQHEMELKYYGAAKPKSTKFFCSFVDKE